MKERPLREFIHMSTAFMWAERSLCLRAKVGTIITTQDLTQIRSFGYNGPAKKLPENRCTGQQGLCLCLHSETNALLRCKDKDGVVLFTTVSPCIMCSQQIINAGIQLVNFAQIYRDAEPGLDLLKQSGVETFHLEWSKQMAMDFVARWWS